MYPFITLPTKILRLLWSGMWNCLQPAYFCKVGIAYVEEYIPVLLQTFFFKVLQSTGGTTVSSAKYGISFNSNDAKVFLGSVPGVKEQLLQAFIWLLCR